MSEPVACAQCGRQTTEPLEVDGEEFCDDCYPEIAELVEKEEAKDAEDDARKFAVEHCRITREIPDYDPEGHWAPTREEFEMGCREAYTANAVLAAARHSYTNYDELIWQFPTKHETDPRERGRNSAFYSAIRRRIEA